MSPTAISFPSCGKRYGRKGRWMRGAFCGTPFSAPRLQAFTNHTVRTSARHTTRRLFGKNQICKQLRLFRCKQGTVQPKSSLFYVAAGSLLPSLKGSGTGRIPYVKYLLRYNIPTAKLNAPPVKAFGLRKLKRKYVQRNESFFCAQAL